MFVNDHDDASLLIKAGPAKKLNLKFMPFFKELAVNQ